MPLSMSEIGLRSRIITVTGNDTTQKHLAHLGFVPGAVVTVISSLAGSFILDIKNTRIALDKTLANRVMVQL